MHQDKIEYHFPKILELPDEIVIFFVNLNKVLKLGHLNRKSERIP